MTEKRFKYTFKGIEDTLEVDEEYKYTPCNKDGFQDLCEMLNELNDENEQLKQFKNKTHDLIDAIIERYDRNWENHIYPVTTVMKFLKKELFE